ncbi:MAG: PSD1 and planctomycete cytochrome C domain-containing protein [Fimbriiglobus sp.]
MLRISLLVLCAWTVHASAQSPKAVEHFEKAVRPLLVEHCLSCHGAEGKKIKGGLKLTSRHDLLTGGDSGPAIVPGDAAKSLFVEVLEYTGDMKMPPKGKLAEKDIKTLRDWVQAGAVWPGEQTAPKPVPKAGELFTAEQKAYWSFQPIQRPKAPPGRTPIDGFLEAKRQAAGLTVAPPASADNWLRRVSYDLTGLPPSLQDQTEFTKAFSQDATKARQDMIEKLLASPHYGERWGRHWLDVARYADSNGLDENTYFGNAWRYRDYVVRSFNADKPYDQFLREQIAADLLPEVDKPIEQRERLTGLGYLSIGPKLLAEPDKQKMLLDIADEQLDTVGKGILGLTLGCARCHDHKFDPIPTRDYYSLLAIFTSTRTMQNLNTVAKAYERKPALTPEQTAAQKYMQKLRTDLKAIEKEFGKVPKENKAKRTELHLKATEKRTLLRWGAVLAPEPDAILGVEEGSADAYNTQPRNLHVQARGNYVTPLEEAPANFLRIIEGEKPTSFVSTTANPTAKPEANKTRYGQIRTSSGRLEFAQWLTSPKNPLTARVMVNRIWKHHFGEGLVRSVDNFGLLGEKPTHPELLDYLASRFLEQGWSIKQMHREILLTDAYAMGPANAGDGPTRDPENRLLWQYPLHRLEAEAVRDAMLVVAGNLDRTLGGTLYNNANLEYVGTPNYDSTRRSIYLPVLRSKVFDFFQTFDFPDPSSPNGRREATVVAPQSLLLMNNPFVLKQSQVFAERLKREASTDEARIRLAYRLAYTRDAKPDEVQRALRYVQETKNWPNFTHAILASNEFLYLR